MDGGAWWAAVSGVAQSRTRLKRLSSSSSRMSFPGGSEVKRLPAMQETRVRSLGREDPLGEENGCPLQDSCLENSMDGGAWWAAVYGVTQSWTRLKRLSSSSSR